MKIRIYIYNSYILRSLRKQNQTKKQPKKSIKLIVSMYNSQSTYHHIIVVVVHFWLLLFRFFLMLLFVLSFNMRYDILSIRFVSSIFKFFTQYFIYIYIYQKQKKIEISSFSNERKMCKKKLMNEAIKIYIYILYKKF